MSVRSSIERLQARDDVQRMKRKAVQDAKFAQAYAMAHSGYHTYGYALRTPAGGGVSHRVPPDRGYARLAQMVEPPGHTQFNGLTGFGAGFKDGKKTITIKAPKTKKAKNVPLGKKTTAEVQAVADKLAATYGLKARQQQTLAKANKILAKRADATTQKAQSELEAQNAADLAQAQAEAAEAARQAELARLRQASAQSNADAAAAAAWNYAPTTYDGGQAVSDSYLYGGGEDYYGTSLAPSGSGYASGATGISNAAMDAAAASASSGGAAEESGNSKWLLLAAAVGVGLYLMKKRGKR